MKKHLIAAAVAAAVAVPAAAQVTVSGTIDITPYASTKTVFGESSATAADGTKSRSTTNAEQTGGAFSTSELVFSGTEDLGGGLRVSFRYSEALNVNAGMGGARDGWVGLEGGFGRLQVGRMNTAINDLANWTGLASPNTQGTVDSGGADLIAGTFGGAHTIADAAAGGGTITHAAALGGSLAGRTPGVIQYTTPTFSGFRATFDYLQTSADSDGTLNDGDTSTRQMSARLNYAAGPFAVAVAMGERKVETEETTAGAGNAFAKAKVNWVGASYNLGVARVFAAYGSRKDDSTTNKIDTAIATSYDATVRAIGVNVPFGSSIFFASAYDGENNLAAGAADDREANGYQVGVRYNMSKRTFLYGLYGMDKNEDKTKAGNAQADSFKRTQSAIGVAHSF